MKADAIKQALLLCLFSSACTEATINEGKSPAEQIANAISTKLIEEMKSKALEKISTLNRGMKNILKITKWNNFAASELNKNLGNKKNEKSLKSIDQLEKLLEELFVLYSKTNSCFECADKKYSNLAFCLKCNEKEDSYLLGFIVNLSDLLNGLKKLFFSCQTSLKEEFLEFIQESKPLHESFKQKMDARNGNLSNPKFFNYLNL